MATIDIGKIKPVFKGAYNNSTAYVLDDIVYYNGSSYVAKQSTTGNVPTNGTYWNVLASGSGGIWNSSLSLGSANQVVKVNSGATALEFGTLSSDYVKLGEINYSSATPSFTLDGFHTSDYDIYDYIVDNVNVATTGNHTRLRLNFGGSADTSSNYTMMTNGGYLTSSGSYTEENSSGWAGDELNPSSGWNNPQSSNNTNLSLHIRLYNANSTSMYKHFEGRIQYLHYTGSPYVHRVFDCLLRNNATTACSGVTFRTNNGGNYSNYRARIYGIK